MPPTRRKPRRTKVLSDTTKDDKSKGYPNLPKGNCMNADKLSNKGRRRSARSIRGALNGIADMPLDVVHHIFSYLLPLDLLHLARTSKSLRGELMNAFSKPLWKAARQNVDGLPDCPLDMAEPLYANLAFETFCNVCLRPNAGKTDWVYRLRACKLCFEDSIEGYCPDNRHCWWFEARNFLPNPTQAPNTGWLISPTSAIRQYHEAYEALNTDEERKANIDALREMFAARQATAVQMRWWEAKRTVRRSDELDEMRRVRLSDIMTRLNNMGWTDKLDRDDIRQIANMPEVRKPLKLTERAWQKVLPNILPVFEAAKIRGYTPIKSYRRQLAHHRTLPRGSFVPPASQAVATLPEFRAVTELPDGVEVTAVDYDDAVGILPVYTELWGNLANTRLQPVLNEHQTFAGLPAGVKFSAATMCYRCWLCKDILTPIQLVAHGCFIVSVPTNGVFRGPALAFCSVWVRLASKCAYETALRISHDVGIDPDVPYSEMVARNDSFGSLCCPGVHKGALKWEQLMEMVYKAPCCTGMKFGLGDVTT